MNINLLGNHEPVVQERVHYDVSGDTVYKKAARWVVLIGAALLPVFFLPWSTSVLELNKQMLIAGVAGAGMVLWLLDVVMSGRLAWRSNLVDKGVLAVLAATVLASVFSLAKFKSIFGLTGSLSDALVTVASVSIIYYLAVNLFEDKGRRAVQWLSVSLTLVFVFGLLQLFGVHIPGWSFMQDPNFNTAGSPNALGVLAAISLPLLYRARVNKYLDVAKIGMFAALAVLLVLNWWILWAIVIAGMVATIALESVVHADRSGEAGRFRVARFVFPMTVIVLGVFVMVVGLNFSFVKNNLSVEVAPSHSLSLKVATGAVKENFAFGYGPENFSLAFDKYGASDLANTTVSSLKFFDGTSQFMNNVVHTGLVGLAAWAFLLVLIVWSLIGAVRREPGVVDADGVGVISALIASLVAFFLYPFNITLLFALYFLLALYALSVWGDEQTVYNVEDSASLSLVSSLGFIGGLIVSLVGLYFLSLNYVSDLKFVKASTAENSQDAADYAVQAINWNGRDDRYYRLSSAIALSLLGEEINSANSSQTQDQQRNERIQNYISSAVALAQTATQIAPREAVNWDNLGGIYQNLTALVDGTDALSEQAYAQAAALRPGDPQYANKTGLTYLMKAEFLRQVASQNSENRQELQQQASSALLKAEDAFKQAIEQSSNFGLAIYNLGSVYERQGKLKEAISQLETLAPFNTNQPGLAFELGLLYYRDGQKDKALDALQHATLLSPNYANARWYLALIFEERGEVDSAISQLEAILAMEENKDNETVVEKLNNLRAGVTDGGEITDAQPLQ